MRIYVKSIDIIRTNNLSIAEKTLAECKINDFLKISYKGASFAAMCLVTDLQSIHFEILDLCEIKLWDISYLGDDGLHAIGHTVSNGVTKNGSIAKNIQIDFEIKLVTEKEKNKEDFLKNC